MELLFILLLVVFIASMANHKDAKVSKAELLREFGVCPPHKWRYEEIKDHEGVTHAWKLVCDRCGPLKPLDPPERMPY